MSLSSTPPVGFLDTPLELRRQIYRYCLLSNHPVEIQAISEYPFWDWHNGDDKRSLLLVSKQVGSEALEVLYGENVFQVYLHYGGECCLKQYIAEANMGRIRKMEFVMKPQGLHYGRMLDSILWTPILANLRKLSIVAKQPDQFPRYSNNPPFEQDMEEWTDWLKAVLPYVARQLSSSCIIQVDDNDLKETSAVMKESFPSGYRKVQTLAGDFCFRRNEYSEESGYWDEDYYDDIWFDPGSDAS